MGGLTKASRWSWAALLAGLLGLFVFFVQGNSVETSQGIVQLEINGTRFAIPKGYIWYKGAWKGGQRDGVNLWALLPDMQPRTETNKGQFDDVRGHGNVVGAVLYRIAKPVSPDEGSDWQAKRKRESFDRHVKEFAQGSAVDGPYGFKMYHTKNGSSLGELMFRHLPDGSLYFIDCYADSAMPFPSCNVEGYVSDRLSFSYHFGKPHLKDWQAIDKNIRALIRGFETQNTKKQGD